MVRRIRYGKVVVFFLVWLLGASLTLDGYSVLGHEALIDAVWSPIIVPLLLSRYPGATEAQLMSAHAYAYGGCVIQDMGYYPFANHFFSNLAHYVRTGDFIKILLDDSQNINEYAFALGALSHYVADNTGHPLAVNLSVPEMYPRLRRKYGKRVTYEDDPRAHIMTEFSFDVVQIAGAGYLPRTYHNFIGFKVPKRLLQRAFQDTYGLEFSRLFWCEDFSIKVYQTGASEILPSLTQIAWKHERKRIIRINPKAASRKFAYRLSRQNYQRSLTADGRMRRLYVRPWRWRWKGTVEQADVGLVARTMVFFFEALPKVGALQTLNFKPPTPQIQDMFIRSFDVTVSRYGSQLSEVRAHSLILPNRNLDTGKLMLAGRYELADKTYAQLLGKLAKHHFGGMTPELRQNILAFYGNLKAPIATKRHPKRWRKALRQLAALKAAQEESASR